jgi:hypothetical protein
MDAQLLKAVQTIAQSLQRSAWPQDLVGWSQLLLVVLTLATLLALICYTRETAKLRRATQDQVLVTQHLLREAQNQVKEAQTQTEYTLMPIVTLTADSGAGPFAVRNHGNGPAFNVRTRPLSDDDDQRRKRFHHATAISAGGEELANLFSDLAGKGVAPADLARLLKAAGNGSEARTSIAYTSATGRWYETFHTIAPRSGGSGLVIRFDEFRRLAEAPPWMGSEQ